MALVSVWQYKQGGHWQVCCFVASLALGDLQLVKVASQRSCPVDKVELKQQKGLQGVSFGAAH